MRVLQLVGGWLPHRLSAEGPAVRCTAGTPQLSDHSAKAIVPCQLTVVILQLRLEKNLDRRSCAFVQRGALLHQQRIAGNFPGQRMLERVFDVGGGRPLIDKFAGFQS